MRGATCRLCCLCSKLMLFYWNLLIIIRSKVDCCKSTYAHRTSQKELVSDLVIQIIPPRISKKCNTILQMKKHNVYLVQKLVGHPPLQECYINLVLFAFPSVCNARSLDNQFFLFFSHDVSHNKVIKVIDPSFWKKVQILLALEDLKSPKNGPKIKFSGIWQKSYPFRYTFHFSTKVPMVFWLFAKTSFWTIWFWVMAQKPQSKSECRIL